MNNLKYNKVIIWGHPLHSHTHSYIHEGFYRGFKKLGYNTFWLNNNKVNSEDFKNSLFITEGQVASHMPARKDCTYILHNCPAPLEYKKLLCLQFLHFYQQPDYLNKLNPYTLYSVENKILFQPWATNLLPEEIDLSWANVTRRREVHYVGTVSNSGQSKNASDVLGFAVMCSKIKIPFFIHGGYTGSISYPNVSSKAGFISDEDHRLLIQKSYLAPQFSSETQKKIGYVPCRIFKNISYGHYGLTNSETVQEIFEGNLIYGKTGEELFEEAERRKNKQDLLSLMKLVRDKHTYINRIKTLLWMLEQI